MGSNGSVVVVTTCKSCGRSLKDEWRFCPYCKTPVETASCPFCREEIKPLWEFCPFCKNRVKGISLAVQDGNEWLKTILKS